VDAGWLKVKGLLGLGLRARTVIVGVEQVRAAVGKGTAALVIVADDASANSRAKVVPLLEARRVRTVGGVTAEWLGDAVGRKATAAVAVADAALARGILGAIAPAGASGQNGGSG
jgi:ribosomal protein L7Ae-like RNA K-turn-binding protein